MRYSYDLFCQRKGFTLQSYFSVYPESTYNDFITFLNQRNVVPVPEERFNAAKEKYLESIKEQEPTIEVVLEEKSEDIKPRRTRRRRNAKKNVSDIS